MQIRSGREARVIAALIARDFEESRANPRLFEDRNAFSLDQL